jgi:hypothetical protein
MVDLQRRQTLVSRLLHSSMALPIAAFRDGRIHFRAAKKTCRLQKDGIGAQEKLAIDRNIS